MEQLSIFCPRTESQAWLCQDNEATESQSAIHLGIGIPCFYLDEQVGTYPATLNLAHPPGPSSDSAWYDRHATSCAGQPPPCDTAQSLSGCTPGSLDAFLAVEYRWVWLRRNVHHSLGLWNLPAQSAAPEACFPLTTAKPPPTALRN